MYGLWKSYSETTMSNWINKKYPDAKQKKQYRNGTHRLKLPSETWEKINSLKESIGVTRVADITNLDHIGIPVWQAIRPESKNLSVAQGKGATHYEAKISALMESIEMYHAENPPSDLIAQVEDVEGYLGYSVFDLSLSEPCFLSNNSILEWTKGVFLLSGEETYIPRELIRLDFTRTKPILPCFLSTSNGLASGNTFLESVLHGLYEVIERDSLVRNASIAKPICLDTITGEASTRICNLCIKSGVRLLIEDYTGQLDIPCIKANMYCSDDNNTYIGSGAHLDPEVALIRAVTEAAQSRLTLIAGSRDDIDRTGYVHFQNIYNDSVLNDFSNNKEKIQFGKLKNFSSEVLGEDLQTVLTLLSLYNYKPIAINLENHEMKIPVSFVIIPGMMRPDH